ncbi:glycosyltransferase family 4 protein [Brevibacillus sp. 179-C8.2 HS]|uniref:glycosyltransferase family 4 protein n=1 Tax=unclassified Brevibacillus TaxID=2684853 RepID=UPI00399F849D
MSKIKILYIHQYFTTRDGATGTRSYEFAKYLVKQGHEVTLLTGDSSLPKVHRDQIKGFYHRFAIDGIQVIAVRNRYSNYMGFFRRAFAFFSFVFLSILIGLFVKRHDVVLATSTPLTVAIPALFIKKLRRTPFVFEVRDLWPEAPIQLGAIRSPFLISMLRSLERKTYKEAAHIVALSPGMEEGVGRPNVTLIPNCSDLDMFCADNMDPEDLEACRRKYGLATDKLIVIHGGAMGVANGLEYMTDAAKILHDRAEHDILLVLAGEGKTRPQLEKFCMENNLKNVIITGSVPRKEVPILLALSDITMTSFKNIPILATNSPNKFFDSLAAAKPVIVNSAGWTKDIVEKHNIGFYVDPDHPEQLANLLVELKNQSHDLVEMGERARKLAEDKYERIKLAAQMEAVLVQAAHSSQFVESKRRVSSNEG